MKKLTWLSLVLVLVLAVGAISFASAKTMTDVENEINSEPRPYGDKGGLFAAEFNKIGLGDRYSEAMMDLIRAGGWQGTSQNWSYYLIGNFNSSS